MGRVVVVGSGASGVHFALTLLRKGRRVLLLDVGYKRPPAVNPGDSLVELKSNLADPVRYFLGSHYESLILPDFESEYYGFPPSKGYVFSPSKDFRYQASGFTPLVSFAEGGLAEAWTGGSYPFRDDELQQFPFEYAGIAPYYGEVARRIGISGVADDLARFFPLHDGLMDPLELDEHSSVLLESYARRRSALNAKLNCFIGRARVATLSRDLGDRKKCSYSGRCLWGCPSDALYTPSLTLAECRKFPNFEYLDNVYASHFRFSPGAHVNKLVYMLAGNGHREEIDVDTLVLAAGTLSSSRIFLQSIYEDSRQLVRLPGLMDNRQVMMPFVNLRMLGRNFNPNTYQYHQVAMGIDGGSAREYIHGLVTTLKTALVHPIVQTLPFDVSTALSVFRDSHTALGLVNINFADIRRDENYLTLATDPQTEVTRLAIHYSPEANEPRRITSACKVFRKVLRKLDCIAPAAMTHVRPMGASVHYAGAIPMSAESAPLTCTPECRSNDFENLYFVDGTTYPFLPAKNLTFTLMANAVRVAETAF